MSNIPRRPIGIIGSLLLTASSLASDHLDTPTVIADPRSDIGDVYAWTSTDGRQLNLVMTIVGHTFSDKIEYVFHVDSGQRFGKTTATTRISCRFPEPTSVICHAGDADEAVGDASASQGLTGKNHRFRVFTGLRDDPFFNNVKGTRAAYDVAFSALRGGASVDAAECPAFSSETIRSIQYEWRHTQAGPASNLLAGWTTASMVIAVDLDVVTKAGSLLAVWGTTSSAQQQLDRAARPLTGNALIGLRAPDQLAFDMKERYNAATPATAAVFVPEIEKNLALYDGFDGECGNQLLAKALPSSANTDFETVFSSLTFGYAPAH